MRSDLGIVKSWVAEGASVLDLGCGDGTLLAELQAEKKCSGYGLEIDSDKINACLSKRVNVIEQDIDVGLKNFESQSFDVVVMSQTLQAVKHPDLVVEEMLRVGRECIVSFPNFAHWKCRLNIALRGRMPVSKHLPYNWYNTPNIHLCTIKDFQQMCFDRDLRITRRTVVSAGAVDNLVQCRPANFFGETAIYNLTR